MASTSRQSRLFGVQDWTKLYQAYSAADLQSYDYESLRKNFIDYLTKNYPETFNDYVESSEFVALLDVMAYMGQALAFRGDLNARENFLDTAQRRDSVIKLANLVGYNPKRNTSGQGLVKVTSISTSEDITDVNGNSLSNATILWNDPANVNWVEQFNAIINAALVNNQRVGKPGNSQNLLDVKTDEYTVNIPNGVTPTVSFQTDIDGKPMNFELVSVTSLDQSYLYELPPAPANQFNILYRNDKLGYASINTGFFFYFKQGTLQAVDFSFAEKIQNNIQQINVQGINDEDVWMYKLDTNGAISSLWTQVQNVYASQQSNGATIKPIYSVTSRANDEVTLVFSDGVFGEIPVGKFRSYVRSSNALRYTINPSEMNGLSATMSYVSRSGRTETLTFTFSLQTPNSSAQNRESLATIKERAPARYYTQNRMVNGEDYNNFPFTLYNSIIKSKALNRSSIGVSRNLDLLDPTGKYSSTNVFADDGAFTFDDSDYVTSFSTANVYYATEFMRYTFPSILAKAGATQYYHQYYPRYPGITKNSLNADTSVKWHLTSIDGSQVTGYFYYKETTGINNSIAVGSFATGNIKHITRGAMIKFVSSDPVNLWFDENNRLTAVNTGRKSLWISVDGLEGDGNNYGTGNLSSGVGPITLSSYVPAGVNVAEIIPQFGTELSDTIQTKMIAKIRLQEVFALQFYNDRSTTAERWEIITPDESQPEGSYIIKFEYSSSIGGYIASFKNVNYRFSSVKNVRFVYDTNERVFDPKTGRVLNDFVSIIKGAGKFVANVVGQPVQSDGFADDFQVEVSPIDQTSLYSTNPDLYHYVTNSNTNNEPIATTLKSGKLEPVNPSISENTAVFFGQVTQPDGLSVRQLLTKGTVVYSPKIKSLSQVTDNVYEYVKETVFFTQDSLTVSEVKATSSSDDSTAYTITITTDVPHLLSVGSVIEIKNGVYPTSGTTPADNLYEYPYNNTFTVEAILDGTSSDTRSSTKFKFTMKSDLALRDSTNSTASTPIKPNLKVANRFYQSYEEAGKNPVVLLLKDVTSDYRVSAGVDGLSFQYRHNSGQTARIDPATTNIIDMYLVTQAYYTDYTNWIADTTGTLAEPAKPTLNELQQSYGELNSYKMISDSVVLNSVTFKPLFGTKSAPALQATLKVVKNPRTTASDTQIRSSVLSAINTYFAIDNWNFGDKFFFSELSAYLHAELGSIISSVILVPADPSKKFGDMYEVRSGPNEIFVNGATANDIQVITSLNASNMNR